MRGLLRRLPEGGPHDCLLARIKGRRSFLIREWEHLLTVPEPFAGLPAAPWRPALSAGGNDRVCQALRREYAWLFARMSESLRVIMTPFFWLTELRTLAVCLRNRSCRQDADEQLLHESLLSNDIGKALQNAPDAATMVKRLADRLIVYHAGFARLPETFQRGGCGALETALNDISLEQLAVTTTHPVMRRYLALLIDSRNLTAIAKRLRWPQSSRPGLLSGGTVRLSLLEQLMERGDTTGVAALAARLGGHVPVSDSDQIEQTLLKSLGHAVRRMSRDTDAVGIIIDYLWRCGVEARNLGLFSRMKVAGGDAVERELVQ